MDITHETNVVDKRGTYERDLSLQKKVQTHILSYNPQVSHYRRVDAPNRLYLPSDLSIKNMHKNYMEQECQIQGQQCSYRFYCDQVKKQNISFAQTGNEKCEDCESFEYHCKESNHTKHNLPNEDKCIMCDNWFMHIQSAALTRKEYRADCDKKPSSDELYVSADLQKVRTSSEKNFLSGFHM